MSGNNTLGTAVIDVVPNMSGFITEMRISLRGVDLSSIGREIGEGVSRGVIANSTEAIPKIAAKTVLAI